MVFFMMRMTAMMGIAGLTGLLWFQDHTKKVIVLKNTTQSIFAPNETYAQVTKLTNQNETKIQNANQPGYVKKTTEVYKMTSQSKSQKLAHKHLQFGVLALLGSLFLPKIYLLLALGYFLMYQLYYFAYDTRKFTPVWNGFMAGGVGIFGYYFMKKLPFL